MRSWLKLLAVGALIGSALLTLTGSGGASNPKLRRARTAQSPPAGPTASHGPAAQFLPARPIGLIRTPSSLLAFCHENSLLRPVCPRQIPASGSGLGTLPGFYCQTRDPHPTVRQTLAAFRGARCMFAEWDYTAGEGVPGLSPRTHVWGWDGAGWVSDEFSMLSPPLHVGVTIQASRGSPKNLNLGWVAAPAAWPEGAQRASDALLGPERSSAVSLGWVDWYGHDGQLILTPWGPCEAGDELILYLPPNAQRVSYTITLDAWMSALRLGAKGRVLRYQSGPALPHVIATLKTIVSSTFAAR